MGPLIQLVGGGRSELCRRKADLRVGRVINGIEALEEPKSVNKIEPRSTVASQVGRDQVDLAIVASKRRVQGTGPDLRIRGQLEGLVSDLEKQALHLGELACGDSEQAGGLVESCTGGLLVCLEGICSEQQQGCAGIDDAGGKIHDRRVGSVSDALIDSPVVARWGRLRNRNIRDAPRKFRRVRPAEGELAIDSVRGRGRGDVRDTHGFSGDRALLQEVVRNSRDGRSRLDRAGGQVYWADAQYPVDIVKSSSLGADSNGLLLDDEVWTESDLVDIFGSSERSRAVTDVDCVAGIGASRRRVIRLVCADPSVRTPRIN